MDDDSTSPPIDDLLEPSGRDTTEEAIARLEEIQMASVEDRKATLRSLRALVEDRPTVVVPICSALVPFLEDDDRSVRLTTAKLFVALAEATPEAVVPAVPSLADRLANEEEFYYVRARSAEALGYVALDHPDTVDDPEILADFRIGLSFDEPEVKEKLAKALEYVALGDPNRLRHQVSSLAEHLDDENELVRYHLVTALVAISCASPERLGPVYDILVERLEDENAYVRGRAAEAIGLLAQKQSTDDTLLDELPEMVNTEDEPFVVERVRFALDREGVFENSTDTPDTIGTRDGVRSTTASAVDAITSPAGDGACPHCGLKLPEGVPPMCPRCGGPI
ncbi:MAG: HEAT repeat domain-containing protein [Halapricum sp.]